MRAWWGRQALVGLVCLGLGCLGFGCGWSPVEAEAGRSPAPKPAAEDTGDPPPLVVAALPAVDGFDLPVGPPDGAGYYDAQPFGRNRHLGSDYNGLGGGDSDYGDPVFATAAGLVTAVEDVGGGWGLVVRVAHRDPRDPDRAVESLYAHLSASDVEVGQQVARGAPLGAIGDANGAYFAHLHFEVRQRPGLPLGGGYSRDTTGYLDPSAFIAAHRPAR